MFLKFLDSFSDMYQKLFLEKKLFFANTYYIQADSEG